MPFLAGIWKWVKHLFNGLTKLEQKAVHVAVIVLENIKKIEDTNVPDIITALIPGDSDDKINSLIREKLPVVLLNLKLADECSKLGTQNEQLACTIKVIQGFTKDQRKAVFPGLAALIVELTADGKLDFGDCVILSQYVYKHIVKGEPVEEQE